MTITTPVPVLDIDGRQTDLIDALRIESRQAYHQEDPALRFVIDCLIDGGRVEVPRMAAQLVDRDLVDNQSSALETINQVARLVQRYSR